MTTVTAPILAGYTLPHVDADGYHELTDFRGGFTEMASGAIVRDLLSTLPKLTFALDWTTITIAEKDTILAAYAAMVLADSAYTSPFGIEYTVQPVDQQAIDVQHFNTAIDVRCDVSLRFRQV